MSVTLEDPGTRSRAWLNCRFTTQLRRDLAKDDTSQSLHGSGTVAADGVFEQAPACATVLSVCGHGAGNLGSSGHSARRYCTVAGHYSRSPQPAALTESSDPPGSFVKSCLRP